MLMSAVRITSAWDAMLPIRPHLLLAKIWIGTMHRRRWSVYSSSICVASTAVYCVLCTSQENTGRKLLGKWRKKRKMQKHCFYNVKKRKITHADAKKKRKIGTNVDRTVVYCVLCTAQEKSWPKTFRKNTFVCWVRFMRSFATTSLYVI